MITRRRSASLLISAMSLRLQAWSGVVRNVVRTFLRDSSSVGIAEKNLVRTGIKPNKVMDRTASKALVSGRREWVFPTVMALPHRQAVGHHWRSADLGRPIRIMSIARPLLLAGMVLIGTSATGAEYKADSEATIHQAVARANPGDVVAVKPGTYLLTRSIQLLRPGTDRAPIHPAAGRGWSSRLSGQQAACRKASNSRADTILAPLQDQRPSSTGRRRDRI